MAEINEKREVAVNALVDYALAAYVANEEIDDIMIACGFTAEAMHAQVGSVGNGFQAPPSEQILTPLEAFASWLGRCLAERIMERAAPTDGGA
jgi:hypothetical protein